MTALEKIKDMIDFCDAIDCHRALYESLKAVEAELEALQSRSCETCGYLGLNYCEQEICRNGDLDINIRSVYKNFCCNRHKPKENL